MASQMVSMLALISLGLAPERPLRNPPMPNGPQPEFATVRRINQAQKTVIVLQTQVVFVPYNVAEFQNGRQIVRTVYKQVYRMEERVFALEKGTITDAIGKKVSAAEALKRLKVGAAVLIASQAVDPLYLRIIQPDALILVSPQGPVPIPVSPPPFFKDKKIELPPRK